MNIYLQDFGEGIFIKKELYPLSVAHLLSLLISGSWWQAGLHQALPLKRICP